MDARHNYAIMTVKEEDDQDAFDPLPVQFITPWNWAFVMAISGLAVDFRLYTELLSIVGLFIEISMASNDYICQGYMRFFRFMIIIGTANGIHRPQHWNALEYRASDRLYSGNLNLNLNVLR